MGERRVIRACALGLLVFGCAGGVVQADDLTTPWWWDDPELEPYTTFQQWEFDTNANPAVPYIDENPFGDPLAMITGDFPNTRWIADDYGHLGVWTVPRNDWLILDLPNYPQSREQKFIWLQITYSAFEGQNPDLITVPDMSGTFELVEKTQLDDYYWHATFSITIEPNPDFEQLYIGPRWTVLYVDEVVVDTLCIPEPSTAALIIAGPLLLALRQKRPRRA
jgi:hypothetical protein